MASILIVDDHPVARLAIRMLLEKENYTVVGEVDDGFKALQQVKQFNPDLILVDIDILSLNGIDLMLRLRHQEYKGGILVLTGKDNAHYITRCKQAGADGFISKRNNLSELKNALRSIESGYSFFPLQRAEFSDSKPFSDETDRINQLSTKELQVLSCLSKGMKILDIAEQMKISHKTVSTYKSRMMYKLQLNNMVDLYHFSQRHNLD